MIEHGHLRMLEVDVTGFSLGEMLIYCPTCDWQGLNDEILCPECFESLTFVIVTAELNKLIEQYKALPLPPMDGEE